MKLTIDTEKCKGCLLCISVCGQKCLELENKVNKRGQQFVVLKYPDKCTGCSLCAVMCPDCAIEVK